MLYQGKQAWGENSSSFCFFLFLKTGFNYQRQHEYIGGKHKFDFLLCVRPEMVHCLGTGNREPRFPGPAHLPQAGKSQACLHLRRPKLVTFSFVQGGTTRFHSDTKMASKLENEPFLQRAVAAKIGQKQGFLKKIKDFLGQN